MALPKGAVLAMGECMPDGSRRVTLCINRLAHGVYRAYEQKGGSCYKLYPMRGHRFLPPAPVEPFLVSINELVRGYGYY